MTYTEKLKDPRWQKKRLQIMSRDNFTCQLCGSDKNTLHVHHKSYNGDPWESENNDLITLCEDCHAIVEILDFAGITKVIAFEFQQHSFSWFFAAGASATSKAKRIYIMTKDNGEYSMAGIIGEIGFEFIKKYLEGK